MNSKYWRTFCHYIKTQVRLTTAYHPQTDGQTERQNQTLEQYLRIYCCYEQDDWALWLPNAQFAYNDSIHAATDTTPFRLAFGKDLRGIEWPTSDFSGPSRQGMGDAEHMLEQTDLLRRRLELVNQKYADAYDKSRKELNLPKGSQVLLNAKNIKTLRPKKKLDNKFLGPFTILEKLGPVTYRLDLKNAGRVHNVFHISLLEPYEPNEAYPQPDGPLWDTLADDDNEVYDVEKILELRLTEDGQKEYLIRWKDYDASEDSWQAADDISAAALHKFNTRTATRGRGRPPKKKGGK